MSDRYEEGYRQGYKNGHSDGKREAQPVVCVPSVFTLPNRPYSPMATVVEYSNSPKATVVEYSKCSKCGIQRTGAYVCTKWGCPGAAN